MEINNELNNILMAAFINAKESNHEYLTPEHILFASLENDTGITIIEDNGGRTENLKSDLEKYFDEYIPKIENLEPVQTMGFQSVMERAIWHITSAQKKELDLGDIFISILDEEESHAAYFMQKEGITRYELLRYVSHDISSDMDDDLSSDTEIEEEDEKLSPGEKLLKLYTTDLTEKALKGEIDPLIGREDILEQTAIILCRRTKNNPIHVGDPGVGKTAITEGLAQLIVNEDVPAPLLNSKIFLLDMGSMLAGTKFRGDFEERIKNVLNEIQKIDNAILFIDEIHTIVGAGAVSGGSMDASNLLKPVLSSGKLKCIGSTTYEEYKKYFEKDRALSRRFQKIDIPEPTIEETIEILNGLKERYEEHHNVMYTEEAITAAAELSGKYINDRHLPDKAIDVIDEAGAYARLYRNDKDVTMEINVNDIESIVAKNAKIPEKTISTSETGKLKNLSVILSENIFGQKNAIETVLKAIKRSRAGFGNTDKPIASFLFVGPTGVGKTELARQLASSLGINLLRFDMSEYQEKHTVARLIGAPPGYVGYEEGGLLTDGIRKTPHTVLLLDEIEKAHGDIFNTLLQVMDYATLTDNNGKKADFRNVIIIMTSNAGAREIGKSQLGFGERKVEGHAIDDAVEKFFSPEFRNRLDSIVTFNHLDKTIIRKIIEKEINLFSEQLSEKDITLEITEKCYDWLVEKGYSPEFGAREIERLIQNNIKAFFVDEVLFGKLTEGGNSTADIEDDKVVIKIN